MDRSILKGHNLNSHTKWSLVILLSNKSWLPPRGSSVSLYLYNLCRILANKIGSNKNIKRINVGNSEHKISQYADDTSIFLDDSKKSLNELLKELEDFAIISSLKVNFEKTQLYWTKIITQLVNGPISVWLCGVGQSVWDILLNYSQRIVGAQWVASLQHGSLSSNLIGQNAFLGPRRLPRG